MHVASADDANHPELAPAELDHSEQAISLGAVQWPALRPRVGEVMTLAIAPHFLSVREPDLGSFSPLGPKTCDAVLKSQGDGVGLPTVGGT